MTKRKAKGAYMISAVAEMYGIHPQTLRLYEREGLLKPSRTEGNTRLYTDEDLLRLEFILSLARDLGVNIAGMAIILQMRERMEEMQRQIQEFVQYIQKEVLTRASAAADPPTGPIARRPPAGCTWADAAGMAAVADRGAVTAAQAIVSAAVTRAGIQFTASSRRAEAQPKRRYLGDRWPTIASRVLTAR